jgi:hypothetical protein
MGIPLLGTGVKMTTRRPVHVQMIRGGNDNSRVERGHFEGGRWVTDIVVAVDATKCGSICFGALFDEQQSYGVQSEPLFLRVCAPTISNITLVDLPGLTMTALTSEGQPADMCEQIRDMIRGHIDDRTLVLLVCAARADLEADAALEFCRTITNGHRTLVCLTKVDMCGDTHSELANYLIGKHASDLCFEHGYFAVNCGVEYSQEIQYFSRINEYGVRSVVRETRLDAIEKVRDFVCAQEAYIFTDSSAFLELWTSCTRNMCTTWKMNETDCRSKIMRAVLDAYFDTVRQVAAEHLPKVAVYSFGAMSSNLYGKLATRMTGLPNAETLAERDCEFLAKHAIHTQRVDATKTCMRAIDAVLGS